MQVQVVGWTRVSDAASAAGFAAAVDAAPRALFGGGTSISGAIDASRELLARAPFAAGRRIVDISGDGANNRGRPAELARDEAVADGVSINGLPILTLEPDLAEVYRERVIGGPGAFVVAIDGYDQLARAILHKLVSEIAQGGEFGARGAVAAVAGAGRRS